MSANLVVDIGNTCQCYPSITSQVVDAQQSGGFIGNPVDMLHSDTFCNMGVMADPTRASGQLRIQVQCSDSDVSGTYTDPTSGLQTLPTSFQSGGILILNSGGVLNGVLNTATSGQQFLSGFFAFAAFQRTGRFVRANVIGSGSDWFAGNLAVGFVSQYKTTGSGGGFTFSPGSGTVNV